MLGTLATSGPKCLRHDKQGGNVNYKPTSRISLTGAFIVSSSTDHVVCDPLSCVEVRGGGAGQVGHGGHSCLHQDIGAVALIL